MNHCFLISSDEIGNKSLTVDQVGRTVMELRKGPNSDGKRYNKSKI